MTRPFFTTEAGRHGESLCASASRWWIVVLLLVSSMPAWADLSAALAQTNLEKRSELALNNASAALKTARKAYDSGDKAAVESAISEMRASVELMAHSLRETGKNPRNHPKYFKKAEIGTRDLLRRLDAFQREMSYVDRPMLDPLKEYIQQAHEDLLAGLMGEKQK